ncbi:MAG: hypothetical protein IPP37_14385 [Saprospiraceae bacterium]|nr:hypothetical protein [Saprospiraceae bacterium]
MIQQKLMFCLVKLAKLDDTIVIKQIEISQNKRFPNEYLKYFDYLVKMRTKNSFKKIGDYLISDLNHITSSQDRNSIRQMALSLLLPMLKISQIGQQNGKTPLIYGQ